MASGASCSVTLTQNSQNVTNNTSSVTATVKVTTWGNTYNKLGAPGTISFSGNYSGSWNFTAKFGKATTTTVYTQTFTVGHSSNGSASVSASVSITTNTSAGTIRASTTKTLTTIPRASEPTVSGTTELGSTITINTNRKASGFTHTLKYRFNNGANTGTIATGVGTSYQYALPMSFANSVTDKTSFNFAVICETYNGSTHVGTKETVFTVTIPSSVVPSFSSSSVTDGKGYLTTYGAFVQNKSNVKVVAKAAGIYSSTIKDVSASFDGLSASGANSATLTLGAPPISGSRTVNLTATDSRGRSISATKAITVALYTNPTLSVKAFRCNVSSGTEDDESTTVRVRISGSVCNINNKGVNTGTVKIEYKLETASSWITANNAARGQTFSFNYDIPGMATENRYDIRVTVTDKIGTIAETSLMIMTAQPVIDFYKTGSGMGIGTVATKEDTLDIGYDIIGRGKMDLEGNLDLALASKMSFNGSTFLKAQSNGRPTIANHIALANGTYLQGLLANGSATDILRMNTADQVELNWTPGGLKGRVMKEIWSGTWTTAASITVPDLPYYNVFFVVTDSSAMGWHTLIGYRQNNPSTSKYIIKGLEVVYEGNRSAWHLFAIQLDASKATPTVLTKPPDWKNPVRDEWVNKSGWGIWLPISKIYGLL